MEDRARIASYLGEIMRRIVATLAVLVMTPGLALAQLNPLSYAPLDSGLGLNPILEGTATATIVTTGISAQFTYGTTVYNAVMTPQAGGPAIAVFTFTNVDLGGKARELTITGSNTGANPVAILSHQNITMIPVAINGGVVESNPLSGTRTPGVGGGAGGANGQAGTGPSAGSAGVSGGGGGGGNGGAGGTGTGTGGGAGGSANVSNLLVGGGGGGGGGFASGGGGGGAIELGAVDTIAFNVELDLFEEYTPVITANGGAGSTGGSGSGGGGAGGQIYLHAKQVIPLPRQAFTAIGGDATYQGGGGGGGKIIIDGLQSSDPASRGVPIATTFASSGLSAAGGTIAPPVNNPNPVLPIGTKGGAGQIVLRPSLPIVTTQNITLDGGPIVVNGSGTSAGAILKYIIDRDLQVGTNQSGVASGYARLGVNEPLAANAHLAIEATGIFQTGAFKQTVAKLTGSGRLELDAGGTVALASDATVNFDFTGSITGTGTFQKAGRGMLIRSTNLEMGGAFQNLSGVVAVNGASIRAATAFSNAAGAEVQLLNLGSSIVSPTLTNLGRIVGSGTVDANLSNQPGGVIRVMEGDSQRYIGATNNNAGNISLLGGTIEFTQGVTNVALTGGISGRGTIIADGGILNEGFMAFSGGNTDIIGNVLNLLGQVSTVGNSTSSFYGDFLNGGTVLTATGSTTVFLGSQAGIGSFTGGGTVEYAGPIIPGNSPALVSYGGNVTLAPSATLKIELGGTTRGAQYDALNIAGAFSTNSALEVSLINGFTPLIGQTFDILNWGSLSGQFSSVALPTLPGASWDTSQLYVNGTLRVVAPTVNGDFDGNGFVDANDLNGWKAGFGKTTGATKAQGDADGDGDVDGADFMAWQRGFGQPTSFASPTTGAVPEPNCLLLALGALLPLGFRLRQR
ncbi:hypothetical protein [Lacipirellula limnantheis]|uniref:Autotransporter-associated beta strand repeat protein n=1 Tax=Lacipirellula limnantheis TaxID=2528024 RepID=A0A517U0S3_9BACT|nr:hypothetical protein [Lacipirellula limnantheis]QDT74224.1 hypothetical protein I41_34190 [Lacipirellula limnantheis]